MKRLAAPFLLALLSVSMAVPSCSWFEKHAQTVADDVKACFGPDVKGDLGDFVKGIGTALVCDLASGGSQLPACTIEGLQTIAEEIGPSGKADVQCVVTKLATDAAGEKVGASPEEVIRTKRAKLYVQAMTLALRSQGDSTPKTGPTASHNSTKTWGARLALPGADGAPGETSLADAREPAGMPDGPVAPLLRGGPEAGQRAHNPSSPVQFRAPQPFAYTGETPAAALGRCYRACGDNAHGAIAPPGGCECWRHVGSTWRWVATNERTR